MKNVRRTENLSPLWATARSGAITSAWIERRRRRPGGGHALAIQRNEIDRFQQQRRETAVARRSGDDLAREREQQPRAFDQHGGLQTVSRHVEDTKDAGVEQFEAEQHHP